MEETPKDGPPLFVSDSPAEKIRQAMTQIFAPSEMAHLGAKGWLDPLRVFEAKSSLRGIG